MTYHKTMKYYKKEEGKEKIVCLLCRHSCKLKEGHCPKYDRAIDGLW